MYCMSLYNVTSYSEWNAFFMTLGSFSDLEVTSRLIRISILEGELLYSQRKVFS